MSTKMGRAIHGTACCNQWRLTQPVAKTPPSNNVVYTVYTRLSTPPPPSSSHSSHEAAPPPLGPSPPINNQIHQSLGACVTSTSSPPPSAIVPMIPNINDCSSDSADDSETSSCQKLVCDFRDSPMSTYEFTNEFEFTHEFRS